MANLTTLGLTRPHYAKQVVFVGQSWLTLPGPPFGIPEKAMRGLGVPYANRGIPGCSWTLLLNGGTIVGIPIPDAATWAWPYLLQAEETTMVTLGGTSDVTEENDTGSQVYADHVAYVEAARAVVAAAGLAPLKVIGCTVPPATAITGSKETARTDHNSRLLSNEGGHFTATLDVGVAPMNDPSNTAYFDAQGLHPTALGATGVAAPMHDTLATVIAA